MMIDLDCFILGYDKKRVPVISHEQCEELGTQIYYEHKAMVNKKGLAFDPLNYAEFGLKLNVDYQHIFCNAGEQILGAISFNENESIKVFDKEQMSVKQIICAKGTVILDASLESKDKRGRHNFTMGHEIAHWHLHQNIYGNNKLSRTVKCCRFESIEKESPLFDRVEHQANYLASCFLMPKEKFSEELLELFYENGNKYGVILSDVEDSKIMIHSYAAEMAEIFDVSTEAAKIRIHRLGFIKRVADVI